MNVLRQMNWIIFEQVTFILFLLLIVQCEIDSSEKQCGMCSGKNNTCDVVSGLFTRPRLPRGYNLIARIPRGACNISITELRQSRNYLALRIRTGRYVINGNWAIHPTGKYQAAGTTFVYKRHSTETQTGELISAEGPTTEPVDVLSNQGITYKYTIPSKKFHRKRNGRRRHRHRQKPNNHRDRWTRRRNRRVKGQTRQDIQSTDTGLGLRSSIPARNGVLRSIPFRGDYTWRLAGFTECSVSCGGGTKKTMADCVKLSSVTVVGDNYCDPRSKPRVQTVRCNTHPCPTRWVFENWSSCSTTCGQGTQTRVVRCKQNISQRLQIVVADTACLEQEKPVSEQSCQLRPCAKWKAGEWSKCSVECGNGIRKRQVQCLSDSGSKVDNVQCFSSKPAQEEVCHGSFCSKGWYFSSWSDTCSANCGSEVQRRKVICLGGGKEKYGNDNGCDLNNRPKTEQHCAKDTSCGGRWFTGSWSKCSSACGNGTQTRDVVCMYFTRGQWRAALDLQCQAVEKPLNKQACNLAECRPEWYVTEWSECTKSCDTGVQTRSVTCVDLEQQISQQCNLAERPNARQACNISECPSATKGLPENKDSKCSDKYSNCKLVVRARLCHYSYYRNLCCGSCAKGS
ncbi:thrombospondin type-1 domain-containing protein 4-like isoform X2 [Tachypleus tridentatus]|uniref:thrombospondin type-1 domain-containing protein 4-like isoform X2 n=1 Tax=Tachypleus tridentatus TaxID=6853 RepID=UPI003FD365DB